MNCTVQDLVVPASANHFMEALEALTDARDFICRFDEMDDGEIHMSKSLSGLIAKLEEVED